MRSRERERECILLGGGRCVEIGARASDARRAAVPPGFHGEIAWRCRVGGSTRFWNLIAVSLHFFLLLLGCETPIARSFANFAQSHVTSLCPLPTSAYSPAAAAAAASRAHKFCARAPMAHECMRRKSRVASVGRLKVPNALKSSCCVVNRHGGSNFCSICIRSFHC